jgi:hypothetical protein
MPEPPVGNLKAPESGPQPLLALNVSLPKPRCPHETDLADPTIIQLRQSKEARKNAAAGSTSAVAPLPQVPVEYLQKQEQFLSQASSIASLPPEDREAAYSNLKHQILGDQ